MPDEPGIAAQIFKDVADKDINIRLIIQSAAADHRAGITFIIEDEFADLARKLVSDWTQKGLAKEGMVEKDWATIAIIGHRLAATPGLSARMFASLANAGINVDCISSSEMTLSCIIKRDEIERGVKAVHDEFFANEVNPKKAAAAVK